MKLEKYKEYKASGVFYIGDIPNNWIVTRNKYIAEIKGRIGFKGYTKEDFVSEGNGALVLGATEMTSIGKIILNNPQYINWFKYYESPEIMVRKNDILIVQRGSTVGKIAIFKEHIEKVTINPSLVLLKNYKLDGGFYFYFLNSASLQSFIKAETATTAIPMISQAQIGNYFILIPPLKTQTAIANYLDQKTSAIDKKVKLLEQKVLKYKELRKSIINQAVTKGVKMVNGKLLMVNEGNDIKFKDSGISWIGKIPEHWEVKRIKDIAMFINGYAFNSNDYIDNGISIVRIGDIKNIIDIPKTRKVSRIFLKIAKDAIIRKNDILIAMTGATIGKSSLFIDDLTMLLNQRVGIVRSKNLSSHLIRYHIQSDKFKEYIDLLCGGSAQENIGKTDIEKYFIQYPPSTKEQTQIAEYLDDKTSTIDNIVENIEKQINVLKELRKTLINDVVTGKIKVNDEK